MKYIVEFELEKNELKADYRRIFISFFKKALSEYMDGYFFDEVYNSGAKKKSLVWSVRFDEPKFKNGMMELNRSKVVMTLKIEDKQTALIYYSSILGMKGKKFPLENSNSMILKRIKLVPENEIVEEITVFKVLSPICLREHDKEKNKDWYYSYGEREFETKLRESLLADLEGLDSEISELEFDISGLKRVVVPAFNLKIPATIGVFTIKGDKRILNHILKAGIGSKRNAGFGLVENILL